MCLRCKLDEERINCGNSWIVLLKQIKKRFVIDSVLEMLTLSDAIRLANDFHTPKLQIDDSNQP